MKLASLLLLLPSLGIAQCIPDKVIGTLEAATSIGVTENGKYLLKGTVSLPKNYLNVSFPFRVMVNVNKVLQNTGYLPSGYASFLRYVWKEYLGNQVPSGC